MFPNNSTNGLQRRGLTLRICVIPPEDSEHENVSSFSNPSACPLLRPDYQRPTLMGKTHSACDIKDSNFFYPYSKVKRESLSLDVRNNTYLTVPSPDISPKGSPRSSQCYEYPSMEDLKLSPFMSPLSPSSGRTTPELLSPVHSFARSYSSSYNWPPLKRPSSSASIVRMQKGYSLCVNAIDMHEKFSAASAVSLHNF